MATLPKYFISCDWGTTNFRLRLVDTQSLTVLGQHRTDMGIKSLNERYLHQKDLKRIPFFTNYLKEQILQLPPVDGSDSLVVMSGMASSTIGLKELAYADLPFDHSGTGLKWKHIATQNGLEILLISGAKSDSGIMRGEEIHAIGLQQHLSPYQGGILILPGTHSKHLTCQEGQFTGLRNFMTGELFEVISKYSILNKSISKGNWGKSAKNAFKEGLHMGLMGGLTSNLFTIRSYHLLKDYSKQYNYYKLSGMLIGDELSYLKGNHQSIFLSAPNPAFDLYKAALEEFVDHSRLVFMDENTLEEALLIGQKKILTIYEGSQH